MPMNSHRYNPSEAGMMLGDGALLASLFIGIAYVMFGDLQVTDPRYYGHYITLFWWAMILWLSLSMLLKTHHLPLGVEIRSVVTSFGRMALILGAALAAIVVSVKGEYYSRAFLLIWLGSYLLIGTLYRSLWVKTMRSRFRQGKHVRFIALVGEGSQWPGLVEQLSLHPEYGYRIACQVKSFQNMNQQVDEYWVSPSLATAGLAIADEQSKRLRVVPDLGFLGAHRTRIIPVGDYPIVELRPEPLTDGLSAFAKRLTDLLVASLSLLLIASWLFPLIAIAIKIDGKGSVFFKQQRHGQKGQNFMIWKFRTMRQSADTALQGKPAQQRVTGIGHWLRVSHLDELPQLWNVILGHMSLVGPRPHMSSDHHMYQDAIASYGIRHWVKPGMTGLAQARGLKGEVDKSGMTERIRADIYYVENWSMLLDLKVLVATVFRLKTWV